MPGFEKRAKVSAEDQLRSRSLLRTQHKGEWGDRARALGAVLGEGDLKHVPDTAASSRYMRHHRDRIIGNLAWLLDDLDGQPASTFCLIRKTWACDPGGFDAVDPISIKRSLRKNIYDLVIDYADGWLFAFLEASFDPQFGCYQFHYHGIATGGYIYAVDKLRDLRGFKPWEDSLGLPACGTPVQLKDIVAENVASQSGYPAMAFWKMRNAGPRRRLPGIEHTRSLLFFDQWRLEDRALLIGVGVKDGRLQQTNRKGE